MERWGRSDQMRECLCLHQHEFAERTRQRHVLLFVCMRVYVWVSVYLCVFRSFTVPGSYLGLGNWTKPLINNVLNLWCVKPSLHYRTLNVGRSLCCSDYMTCCGVLKSLWCLHYVTLRKWSATGGYTLHELTTTVTQRLYLKMDVGRKLD